MDPIFYLLGGFVALAFGIINSKLNKRGKELDIGTMKSHYSGIFTHHGIRYDETTGKEEADQKLSDDFLKGLL